MSTGVPNFHKWTKKPSPASAVILKGEGVFTLFYESFVCPAKDGVQEVTVMYKPIEVNRVDTQRRPWLLIHSTVIAGGGFTHYDLFENEGGPWRHVYMTDLYIYQLFVEQVEMRYGFEFFK